jgi:hypothetical protein
MTARLRAQKISTTAKMANVLVYGYIQLRLEYAFQCFSPPSESFPSPHRSGNPSSPCSVHVHILIFLFLGVVGRDRQALHSKLCRVLVDSKLDGAILCAVGAECCERIAERGLELQLFSYLLGADVRC